MERDFARIITCGNREREFHFTRVNSVDIYFYASVLDEQGKLLSFTLARDTNGRMKITTPDLPQWIMDAEPELVRVVAQEE